MANRRLKNESTNQKNRLTMSALSRPQANLVLLFIALIWGSAFVAQHLGMKEIGPFAFTGLRFLLGALVVLPLALREYRRLAARGQAFSRAEWLGCVGLGGLLFFGAAFQQLGIVSTTVTNAGFFTALYVPLVPLLGWLLFRQLPHWCVWPASAGCLLGTWMLGGGELSALNRGDFWVLASTIFWAAHVLLVGRVAAEKGAPITVAITQFVVCGLLSLLWVGAAEPVSLSQVAAAGWSILYAGVLSVGVAFTLQVIAQRHTHAADAAIILSAETLFAAIAGALFLGDRLSSLQFMGCTLILSGILAVQLVPLAERARGKARAAAGVASRQA